MTAPETQVTVPADRLVTLADGRLGWAGALEVTDGARVQVTSGVRRMAGTARVVRSGATYEEVVGRARQGAGWRARWARRPDAVVVLTPDPTPLSGDDGGAVSAS